MTIKPVDQLMTGRTTGLGVLLSSYFEGALYKFHRQIDR